MKIVLFVSVFLLLINHNACAVLKTVATQDLKTVINLNEYLLVTFVQPDCPACKLAEMEIGKLASSILDSMVDVTFVRVVGMDAPKKHGVSEAPAILFYRHTKPLIYDGQVESAEIEEWILSNRESSLKSLNDDNFEHLTQAATGATTGDWLVFFCDITAEACKEKQPTFETVASKLSSQNAAFVDTASSPALAKRFSLSKEVMILFFRLGKAYHYSFEKTDIPSLVSFAQGWYKNVKSNDVPVPPSPFDQFLTRTINLMQNRSFWMLWGGLAVLSLVVIVLLSKTQTTKVESQKQK